MRPLSFAILLSLAACSARPIAPRVPSLCERYADELAFVHQTMRENNANYNGSAEQKRVADEAFAAGLRSPCVSNLDYARGIKKYLAAYHDPHVTSLWGPPDPLHASVIEMSTGRKPPAPPLPLAFASPGLFLQRYQDRFFVRSIDPKVLGKETAVGAGDELVRCDGKAPREILDGDILPYLPISAYESGVYRFTPLIFFRWDLEPGAKTTCTFSRKGRLREITLSWQSVPDDYLTKTFLPAHPKVYEIEPIPGGHWLKLHSLGGYDAASIEGLKEFVAQARGLRGDRLIVVDLRGNTGGSSNWGTDWIDRLFGYHVSDGKRFYESVFVSPGNREHYERFFRSLKARGGIEGKEAEDNWTALLATLKNPDGNFARIPDVEPPSAPPPGRSAFRGRVIVLTDPFVFSSGETFLEQLRMMPRVKQAGLATNASTYYSDIRFVLTPSGLPFNFPTKMDSGDPLGRRSGEALKPDWPLDYDGPAELRGEDSLRMALERKLAEKRLRR